MLIFLKNSFFKSKSSNAKSFNDRGPKTGLLKARTFWWSLLAFILLLSAMLVPVEWIRAFSGVFGVEQRDPQLTAFSPMVAQLDEDLDRGQPVDDMWRKGQDTGELERARVYLQLRRLTQAGPMTDGDMARVEAILREFNAEIPRQTAQGSKKALKNERNRQILQAAGRLDAEKTIQELDRLDEQLEPWQ